MTAKITIIYDASQVTAGQDKQRKGNKNVQKSYSDVAKEAIKAERVEINSAKRILKSQRDRRKVLSDNVKALRAAAAAGKITREEARIGTSRLIQAEKERQAAIEQTEAKSTKAYRKEKQLAIEGVAAVKRITAESRTLAQQYEHLKVAITAAFNQGDIEADEHRKAIDEIDAATKRLAESQDLSFGQKALANVKQFSAAIGGSLLGVIDSIQRRMEKIRELQRQALQDARTSSPIDARLAANLQERTPAAIERANAAALRFGVSREAAKGILFDATSNGFEREFEDVVRGSLALGAEEAGIAAGKIRAQFPDLSPAQAINVSLVAAQRSALDPSQFTRTSPNAAVAGRTIGASAEETFAAQSQLAALRKSGDESATSLKAFARAANRAGVGGGGFFAAVDQLNKLPADQLSKTLGGNNEAIEAFRDLVFLRKQIEGVFRDLRQARADTGTQQSALNRTIKVQEQIPSLVAARSAIRTQVESELRKEDLAEQAARIEKNERILADNRNPGLLPFQAVTGIPNVIPGVDRFIPDTAVDAVAEVGSALFGREKGTRFAVNAGRALGLVDQPGERRADQGLIADISKRVNRFGENLSIVSSSEQQGSKQRDLLLNEAKKQTRVLVNQSQALKRSADAVSSIARRQQSEALE